MQILEDIPGTGLSEMRYLIDILYIRKKKQIRHNGVPGLSNLCNNNPCWVIKGNLNFCVNFLFGKPFVSYIWLPPNM